MQRHESKSRMLVPKWAEGLVIKMSEVAVEELRKALEDQIELGEGEESSAKGNHAIWLLALRAAQKAHQSRDRNTTASTDLETNSLFYYPRAILAGESRSFRWQTLGVYTLA
eukprot:scaffold58921_cov27-Cyclotella_meneghiniana.AAC.3